jgi:hypothetical protein
MTLIEKENTYYFTSADDQLTTGSKDLNGSRFTVKLSREISVPRSALDVTIECTTANIWFTQPNISPDYKNDKMYFKYGESLITLQIPKGLYHAEELNETVRRLLSQIDKPSAEFNLELGAYEKFPETAIALRGNPATQKIEIKMIKDLWFLVDAELENNIAEFLGFSADQNIDPGQFDGHMYTADNPAHINQINAYLLHGDIVKSGIQINNNAANIITEVQLTSEPGEQVNYRPYHPHKIDGNHLKQGTVDKVTFWITDERNRHIDMNGEDFSFTLTIKYKMLSDQSMMQGRSMNMPSYH